MMYAGRVILTGLFVAAGAWSAGCAAPVPMTATQMQAMQTRQVEAPMDRAFSAASHALLDSGYVIEVSDSEAGVLAGQMREDPAAAANWGMILATLLITMGHAFTDLPPTYKVICLLVSPSGPDRSTVRIRSYENAKAGPDAAMVREIWVLMQREVMMKGAPRPPGE